MQGLLTISKKLDSVTVGLGKLAGWLIIPIIALIMFDVVTRKIGFLRVGMSELSWYYLIAPIKIQDMQWHLHGALLLMSFGFGYVMNAHVRVDIFRERLSALSQAKMELTGLLVMALPYIAILLYNSFIFVYISYAQNEGSESLTGIPMRYIIKSFTIFGFTLALFAVLSTIFKLLAYVFGDQEARDAAVDELKIFAIDDQHGGHQPVEAASSRASG